MNRALGVVPLILGVLAANSARAADVTGFVRTGGGVPIANARVTLFNADTSVVTEARSNAAGAYQLSPIAPGTWRLGASANGRAYAETVRTVAAANLAQDFVLGADVHPGRWTTIGDTDPENLFASNSGSLLPDGRILYCHDTLEPVLFNPTNGSKSFPAQSPSYQGCHVTTLLSDGALVFIGGQDTGDFTDAVRTVKKFAVSSGQWTLLPDLYEERWYPGLARLADGRLLAMGGGQRPNAQRTATCEIFDPGANVWTRSDSMSNPSDYPPAVLLYNGKVLRTWWPPQLYDVGADDWQDTGAMVQPNRFWPGHCDHSLVVLPDGRACAVGVFRGSLVSPSMIELYDPVAGTWSLGSNASTTRSQPEVVMLPTGQVFVAGGKLEDPGAPVSTNAFGQVKLTDLYDPPSNSWRRCADMVWHREYHAVTVLVPDGRVVTTAGTGGPAMPGISNDVEAFEPPYLFRGVRPRIDALSSATLVRGGSVALDVSRTDSVTSVILMGTDAVTHWVNGGVPRLLRIPFNQSNGVVTATVPADANLAPLGHYMLFVMVDDVPSVGRIVRVEPGTVDAIPGGSTGRLALHAWPNPSGSTVTLAWNQPRRDRAEVAIFDIRGRLVAPLGQREYSAGWQQVTWDGGDSRGRPLEPGIYWVRIRTGSHTVAKRVVRVP